MVAAVHFYATSTDQLQLLDYLGEPQDVRLLPWPVVSSRADSLTRSEALTRPHVTVVNPAMGRPDLDIERPDVTTLFALPGALEILEDGGLAR